MTIALLAIGPSATLRSAPSDCALVSEGPLTAVLWRGGQGLSELRDKRRFGRALVEFQRRLEAIQDLGPLLAAAPGARLRSEAETRALLVANRTAIEEGLKRFGGVRQFQVTVSWDLGQALLKFAGSPEVLEARMGVKPGSRLALGKALQTGMEAVRKRLASCYEAKLAKATVDRLRLPRDEETIVLNIAAAVAPGQFEPFERAVEAIDATWPDGLRIRLVGPLPAISFAATHIERPRPEDVRAARERLGLVEGASLEEIRDAFRRVAKTAHPDVGGDAESADATVEARDLLVRVAAAGDCYPGAPLIALRREGDAEIAA